MPKTRSKMRRAMSTHSRNESEEERSGFRDADAYAMSEQEGRKRRRSVRMTHYATSPEDSSGDELSTVADPRGDEDTIVVTDKATSQLVTSWVKENYQYERDHNVPRRGMYEHYKAFCSSCHTHPVNSATFGKLIRTVFPEIKTRRLGTRGQSKYHYCGIRMRHTLLSASASSSSSTRQPRQTVSTVDVGVPSLVPPVTPSSVLASPPDSAALPPLSPFSSKQTHPSERLLPPPTLSDWYVSQHAQTRQQSMQPHSESLQAQQSMEPSHAAQVDLPPFVTPSLTYPLPLEYNSIANRFTLAYEKHCRDILMLVKAGQFEKIERILSDFYLRMPDYFRNLIRNSPDMVDAIWRWDSALYDTIIATLLPRVYSRLSSDMVRGLRHYTRELETYISFLLKSYPPSLYQKKSDVARIFVAKFRRHLSLNHMAQAAATVLSRSEEVRTMQEDWAKVDVGGVIDQALWVCDCRNVEIEQILQRDISGLLREEAGLEQWMMWCQDLVSRYMNKNINRPSSDCSQFLFHSKQFVLKWTLYTSLIMRDLTLRSAPTYLSYQVLQLFFDDYVLYLVEERVAQMNTKMVRAASTSRGQAPPPPAENNDPILSTPPASSSGTRSDRQDTSGRIT